MPCMLIEHQIRVHEMYIISIQKVVMVDFHKLVISSPWEPTMILQSLETDNDIKLRKVKSEFVLSL